MEDIEAEKSNISEAEIVEPSKKYEDFTEEDFKRHLASTYYALETNTRVSREFFESFPVFTIHKKQLDGFANSDPHPEESELNVGSKVRSLYTKRKDFEDA